MVVDLGGLGSGLVGGEYHLHLASHLLTVRRHGVPPDSKCKSFFAYHSCMTDPFKALSDRLRRLIVDELAERDGQTLFELCARLALKHQNTSTRQAVSHHLKLLEEAGIISTRREGRTKVHRLEAGALRSVTGRWVGVAPTGGPSLRITQTSIFVDDQDKALDFYTSMLGFVVREDEPAGEHRWIALSSPGDPNGPVLVLEPDSHPAIESLKRSLMDEGSPFTAFAVADLDATYVELTGRGVVFTQPPINLGTVISAVLDDTCGNLIQLNSQPLSPSDGGEGGNTS